MSESRAMRRTAAAALALILVMGAGACDPAAPESGAGAPRESGADPSSGGAPSAAPQAFPLSSTDVVKDEAAWTLPTDPYFGHRATSLYSQADGLVTKACMDAAGFPQYQAYYDASRPQAETLAGDGISHRFSEDLAAKYGYRDAPDPQHLPTPGNGYEDQSQEFHNAWDTCMAEAVKGVPADPDYTPPPAMTEAELEQYARDQAKTVDSQLNRLTVDTSTGALPGAVAAWRECMAPLGIVDLPNEPFEIGMAGLPDSLRAQWAWSPAGAPSEDEIRVASFDAACRRSSGWFDALYEAEWDLRAQFVADHADELAARMEKNHANEQRFQEIIAQYSQPTAAAPQG